MIKDRLGRPNTEDKEAKVGAAFRDRQDRYIKTFMEFIEGENEEDSVEAEQDTAKSDDEGVSQKHKNEE